MTVEFAEIFPDNIVSLWKSQVSQTWNLCNHAAVLAKFLSWNISQLQISTDVEARRLNTSNNIPLTAPFSLEQPVAHQVTALTWVTEINPKSLLHQAMSYSSLPEKKQQGRIFWWDKELFSHVNLCLPTPLLSWSCQQHRNSNKAWKANLYSSSLQGSPYNMHLIRLYNGLKPKKLVDKALQPVNTVCKING